MCLVQPPVGGIPQDITPPLGLLQLAASLEAAGRACSILDFNLVQKTEGLRGERSLRGQFARRFPARGKVDVFGVTAWSYNFDVAMELVEELRKRHPQACIVLGGPHASFSDAEILAHFGRSVDFVLRDEGDHSFPLLLEVLERGADSDALSEVPGLSWIEGGRVRRNPRGAVVEDLDALPFPAYHLVDVAAYLALSPVLVLEAGRGCPYNCNFCSTTNMFQRKYRVKSPSRLVDEIEWLMERSQSRRFELLHDNLVANKAYVRSLCREIRARNIDVSWSCTSRTDNITEELAEEMFLAGCDQVFFGVESLDAERQKWTGKRLDPERVREAIELTARQHIHPQVGIIVGFPDERREEFDLTVGEALRWVTDPKVRAEVSTGLLRYYPGADLFAEADALRYDPLAAADTAAVPGYSIRKKWRGLPRLFPLQAIHTGPAETRRNLLTVKFLRTVFRACPLTVRACLVHGGLGARELFDRMMAGRRFEALRARGRDPRLLWNETLRALGAVVEELGRPEFLELLDWEAPFWRTEAVVAPLERIEHVVHERRYEQASLEAFARGERRSPEPAQGLRTLGVRAGPEVAVWATRDPAAVLRRIGERLGGAPTAFAPLARGAAARPGPAD
ncbi:MAG: radical SAM protein, partial [Planctomycetota bacterium]